MSQFSQWDDPNAYIEQNQTPPASSKIDKFKKAEDESKVGKVEHVS